MAIKAVKYNPSATPISGTEQKGQLAIVTGTPDYGAGEFYGGVEDSDGYVIVSDTYSMGWTNQASAKPTFWKTTPQSDSSLLALINTLPEQNITKFNDIASARAWVDSSNKYTILPLPVAADSIRSALSTNQSAYDAASSGDFIKVTAAEYSNVFDTISGATKYINDDTDLGSSATGWTTGYNISFHDSTKALGAIPSSNYIIGYAYRGNFPVTSVTTYLRTGTSPNGTHTKLGSNITFTDSGAKTVYFIRKTPSQATSSKSYVSFYTTGNSLGQVAGKSNYPIYYSQFIDTNTWSSIYNGGYPCFQVLSTSTKSW